MQTAPIVAISALLGVFVFLAIALFTYQVILGRKQHRKMAPLRDLESQRPSRFLTVLDGKVVPMQEGCRASTINRPDWRASILATYYQPSTSAGPPLQQTVKNANGADCGPSGLAKDSVKQLNVHRPMSKAISREVKQHTVVPARTKRKRRHQEVQSQPPTYSFVVRGSTAKAFESMPDYTDKQEEHNIILPPRRSSLMPPKKALLLSKATARSSLIAYLQYHSPKTTPKSPPTNHSTSTQTSISWRRRRMGGSLLEPQLRHPQLIGPVSGLSSQGHKDLPPLPPSRTAKVPSNAPNHPFIVRSRTRKPTLDLTALRDASISALPPSAFSPYRLTRPTSGSLETARSKKPEPILSPESKLTSFPPHSDTPPTVKANTSGTFTSPENYLSVSHSAQSATPAPSSSPFTSAILGRLADVTKPSTSPISTAPADATTHASASSTATLPKRSTGTYRHLLKSPKPSIEDFRHSCTLVLDSSTDIEGSVTSTSISREHTPLLPETPHLYRFGNARCVSIYSNTAFPTTQRRPPRRLPLPIKVDGPRHWRDKPLPSPRSQSSGNMMSAAAQSSFVVSPLSSHFSP